MSEFQEDFQAATIYTKKEDLRIIKVRDPCVPLTSCTTHIIEMPCHCSAMDRHIKDMLCDSHCLNTRVEDVIYCKRGGQVKLVMQENEGFSSVR